MVSALSWKADVHRKEKSQTKTYKSLPAWEQRWRMKLIDCSHMGREGYSIQGGEWSTLNRDMGSTGGGQGPGPARAIRAKTEVGMSSQLQDPIPPHPHICLGGRSVPRSQGQGPGQRKWG